MGNRYIRDESNNDDNSADDRMVTINGFCFCTEHGGEYCPYCTCDYRMGNNAYVEDYLDENVSADDLDRYWEGDDRDPIQLHGWMIFDNGKPGCVEHQVVGCQKCFNWAEQLVTKIKAKKN
ncbi:unnamed protein product [Absidia cylindrospora]